MDKQISDFDFIRQKISELLLIVKELEDRFPDRKFSLDGHLFGSMGEAIARYYYGITLYDNSTKKHDGEKDGKQVQIKITQGSSVDINGVPDNLLVLFLHKKDGVVYEVYNGPCAWLENCKPTKNGWYTRSLINLSKENQKIPDEKRLQPYFNIKKWAPGIRNE